MSSKERKKELKKAGKGHHETFEIPILLEHTPTAKNVIREHVPENGGT
jgi:hypothetical protein